jgi:2'-5' RNA ligase
MADSPTKRIRAFVAANLPVAVISQVVETQSEIKDRARRAGMKVGWVPSSSMHLTLKFLAEIPEESVWAVRDVLRDRLLGRPPLMVRVRGAGAFPGRTNPRVLWVGIESADDGLTRLAADVESWLCDLGFSKETRPFHPHLTLGRVKQGAADVLEGLEDVDFGQCSISEVVLYQSVLRREGAEYTPLSCVPLTGPTRGGKATITPNGSAGPDGAPEQ